MSSSTLCALPVRIVMFRPICAYCGKPEQYESYCDFQLAVLACGNPQHQAWAKRDADAWLGRHGYVRFKDYTDDPLFQQTQLLHSNVAVKRSAGPTDFEGWVITKPSYNELAHVYFRDSDAVWTIHVSKPFEELVKRIPVCDLKMSLPEDKHGLVDAFELRLNTGFYIASMQAYEEALQQQNNVEEPIITAPEPQYEDYIVPAFHSEYGYGRIFNNPPLPIADEPATI